MGNSIDEVIGGLVAEGYQVDLGPHTDLSGYYCAIFKPGDREPCPECERDGPTDWDEAGHGHTLISAILNAQDLLNGTGIRTSTDEF